MRKEKGGREQSTLRREQCVGALVLGLLLALAAASFIALAFGPQSAGAVAPKRPSKMPKYGT